MTKWLEWARSLQAISQNGLLFTTNEFEIDRYKEVQRIAAEMLNEQTGLEYSEVIKLFEAQKGYATPKVDVRGVVFKDDKVLLVKEKSDGGWCFPGGWADPNESPAESVEREVFEESGFVVKTKSVLAVYDRDKQGHTPPAPFHIFKIFFLCELTGGEKKLSIETDGVEFFGENEIPPLSVARTLESQIKLFFRKVRDNNLFTEFD